MSRLSLFGLFLASALVSLVFAAAKTTADKEITLENVQYAVHQRGASPTWNSIKLNEKSTKVPTAEAGDLISIKFTVKDKGTGMRFSPHQAFVAFVHAETLQEIIFVSEPDADGAHLAEINVRNSGSDFKGLSGVYNVRLIVGDFKVAQGFNWNLLDVKLTVPKFTPAVVKKTQQVIYEKLPEIHHQFREPEARPSQFVSSVFTIICLAPLGLLFILWLTIGINFGNMPLSIWVLPFHVSLGAIFGLYFWFWLDLNMFQTLNYLFFIGIATFLFGNRLLRAMSAQRKTKTE
ncbi:hypothetical protein L596_020807 [Steinernema carpocapsae]|uniref:Dolichyl-diphosphooligosaccharide--protein glycosyltransferase subunit 2 n=1 Tax=Steinernema carpocapsae TaxID=34508 RepID=A0A4V6A105_STECR|nr:hypothetical protein L596_020730 [Steinernema carpocapsae]TKR73505.1 hypothetical protein L596_020807 [Steinernema carpocapsae]